MTLENESICETEPYKIHYFKRRASLIQNSKNGEYYKNIIQILECIAPDECLQISKTIEDLMFYRFKANGGSTFEFKQD